MNPTQAFRIENTFHVRLPESDFGRGKRRVGLGPDQDRFGSTLGKEKFVNRCALLENFKSRWAQRSVAEDSQSRLGQGVIEGFASLSLMKGYKSYVG